MCNQEPQGDIDRSGSLSDLFQFSNSADCGYFCGMALKQLHLNSGNPSAGQITRREVYEAREQFLTQHLNIRTPIYTHRHDHFLDPVDAAQFLSSLELPHYAMHNTLGGITRSNMCENLVRFMGHRSSSILQARAFGLMLSQIISGSSGHWIAILGDRGPGGLQGFLVYDPSGVRGTSVALNWVTLQQMREFYGASIIRAVVSTAS